MDRRSFGQSLAGLLAASSLPSWGVAKTPIGDHASFVAALEEKPWLLGYLGTRDIALEASITRATGRIPQGFEGDFFRNGPAFHSIGNDRFSHWFDAPGMVQRFRFRGGQVAHQGRLIETARNRAEVAAGAIQYSGFGTHGHGLGTGGSADAQNTANINLIDHAGELLALWEGGSAHIVDPEDLTTTGRKIWSEDTNGLPFGAHPRKDRDGTLWNLGYSVNPAALVLYRISATGELRNTHILPQLAVPMVHDFMITESKIIIVAPPFSSSGPNNQAFVDLFEWKDSESVRIFVLDKDDPTQIVTLETDPFWVFHFGNAYDISPTEIGFDFAQHDHPGFMTHDAYAAMDGSWDGSASAASRYVQATLDLREKRVRLERASEIGSAEFIQTDPRAQLQSHRYTLLLSKPARPEVYGYGRLVLVDRMKSQTAHFDVNETEMLEEHLIVPKPGDDEGFWILGTSLDWAKGQSALSIYDGLSLSDGPLYRADLDLALPLGLHGRFLPMT